jgi:hypothetical protein
MGALKWFDNFTGNGSNGAGALKWFDNFTGNGSNLCLTGNGSTKFTNMK